VSKRRRRGRSGFPRGRRRYWSPDQRKRPPLAQGAQTHDQGRPSAPHESLNGPGKTGYGPLSRDGPRDTAPEMSDEPVIPDYRIGEGGLLRRFEAAVHLTRLHWQVLALLGFTWLPIAVFGLLEGRPDGLVYDLAVHVRLLIAAPMFLIIDQVFPAMCRYCLGQLYAQSFVPSFAQPRLDALLRRTARLTDSFIPEAMLGLLCLSFGVAALRGVVPVRGLTHRAGLSPDQVWYALTDLPLFQFLLWRSVWRWAVWVRILAALSRTNLNLVPTHPDRCGGIRFLSQPSVNYCAVLLFTVSSVVCAEWGTRFNLGASLGSFKPLLLVFGTAGTLIAFGPLLLFVPQLVRAHRRGKLELNALATKLGRRLRRASIDHESSVESETVMALANVEQTYRETVKQLSPFLFDKRDLAALLVATLLPLLPVMLLHIPSEDWRELLTLLTGFGP
jgi:hypothetical protein